MAKKNILIRKMNKGQWDELYPITTSENLRLKDSENFMSDEEKAKLAGVAEGATKYNHPATHGASMIRQDKNNRFVADDEKAVWYAKLNGSDFNPANVRNKLTEAGMIYLKKGHGIACLEHQENWIKLLDQWNNMHIRNFKGNSDMMIDTNYMRIRNSSGLEKAKFSQTIGEVFKIDSHIYDSANGYTSMRISSGASGGNLLLYTNSEHRNSSGGVKSANILNASGPLNIGESNQITKIYGSSIESHNEITIYKDTPSINNKSYSQGHLELVTRNGSDPMIGFHRVNNTAVALYSDSEAHSNKPLKIRCSNGHQHTILTDRNLSSHMPKLNVKRTVDLRTSGKLNEKLFSYKGKGRVFATKGGNPGLFTYVIDGVEKSRQELPYLAPSSSFELMSVDFNESLVIKSATTSKGKYIGVGIATES